MALVEQVTGIPFTVPDARKLLRISPPVNIPYARGTVVYSRYDAAEQDECAIRARDLFLVVRLSEGGDVTAVPWCDPGSEEGAADAGSLAALPRVLFQNWQVALWEDAFAGVGVGASVQLRAGVTLDLQGNTKVGKVETQRSTPGGAVPPGSTGTVKISFGSWWESGGKEQLYRATHPRMHSMTAARPTLPAPAYALVVQFGGRLLGLRLDQVVAVGTSAGDSQKNAGAARTRRVRRNKQIKVQPVQSGSTAKKKKQPLREAQVAPVSSRGGGRYTLPNKPSQWRCTPAPAQVADVKCENKHPLWAVYVGGQKGQSGYRHHSCDFCAAVGLREQWIYRCRMCNVDMCGLDCPGAKGRGAKPRGPRPHAITRWDQDHGVDVLFIKACKHALTHASRLVQFRRNQYAEQRAVLEKYLASRWAEATGAKRQAAPRVIDPRLLGAADTLLPSSRNDVLWMLSDKKKDNLFKAATRLGIPCKKTAKKGELLAVLIQYAKAQKNAEGNNRQRKRMREQTPESKARRRAIRTKKDATRGSSLDSDRSDIDLTATP
eukprot:TRINITY_DN7546_c1_g1_i1.p1 TRINITY_DN7546_c1_g1~~TRINITY_DN7546_c1_g1_i1.p1  ORF type:complete len:587 (+),score=89.14 TRINITY_DN7546_c1_g1_i1:119-1762(+)